MLESSFTVSKSASRTAPYSLSYPLNVSSEIHVMLPEEWTLTSDQSNIETEDYAYDYRVIYDDKFLSLLTNYSTKGESIPIDRFEKFVDDHRKMMGNISYTLTYDKTLSASLSNETPGVAVTVLSLILGIIMVFWLYFRYDPTPQSGAAWATALGGWLILVAIGICLTPFRLLYDFFTNDALLNGAGWLAMWHTQRYVLFLLLLLEHIYNVVYLMFTILIIVLFFQQRSSLPLLISIFYGCNFVVMLLDNLVALLIDPDTTIAIKEIMQGLLSAAIWIPYFAMSERVKTTFVNVREERRDNDALVVTQP